MKNSYSFRLFLFPCLLILVLADSSARSGDVEIQSIVLTPSEQADVPAQTLGILKTISVERGHIVREGQNLAQIDDTDALLQQRKAQYEFEISQNQASDDLTIVEATKQLQFLTSDYQRLMRANAAQPQSVTTSEIERAGLEMEKAEIALQRAKREQELALLKHSVAANLLEQAKHEVQIRKIVSPLEGKVESVLRNRGEWVKPGDSMFRIIGTNKIRAEGFLAVSKLDVSIRDIHTLNNMEVRLLVNVDGKTKGPHQGRVIFVSQLIDPVNEQLRITAEFDNTKGHLTPGLRGSMTLIIPEPVAGDSVR